MIVLFLATVRCSLPLIEAFLNNVSCVVGLQISSQQVFANKNENDLVLIGSYVFFTCKDGYTNIDGNLNVTCNGAGQWTSFPKCLPKTTTKLPSKLLIIDSLKGKKN